MPTLFNVLSNSLKNPRVRGCQLGHWLSAHNIVYFYDKMRTGQASFRFSSHLKLPLPQILDLVSQLRRPLELEIPRRVAHLLVESRDCLGQFLGAVLFEILQIDG